MTTQVFDLDLRQISIEPDAIDEWRDLVADLPPEEWLIRTELGFLVPHHDDVTAMLRDKRWYSALALIAQFQDFDDERWTSRDRPSILAMEGEEHSRLRRLVGPAFTPRAADRLRPHMRRAFTDLLEPALGGDGCDFVADVADPYPIPIICELLGAPEADADRFSHWATEIFRLFNGNLARDFETIIAAQDELDQYIHELIEERRGAQRDDLLSDLIAAEEEGDRLSGRELVSMAEAVLLAGTDTTRNQLACALALFAHHPDQYALLRDDPDLAAQATEEVMRFLGAVRGTARYASEEIEYRDVVFPTGTVIFASFYAANRDREKYSDPGEFDITRSGQAPHLTFGSGIHFCLGAWLARAEMQEALRVLAERVERIELTDEIEWKPQSDGIWGPARLPLRLVRAT